MRQGRAFWRRDQLRPQGAPWRTKGEPRPEAPSLPPASTLRLLSSSKHRATLHHSSLLRTASFFGENHLEVPVATALTSIHLQLEFSTAQPEALLLLAAGPADYLLLQLYSGRLQVSDVALLDSFSSFQCTPPPASCDLERVTSLPPAAPL